MKIEQIKGGNKLFLVFLGYGFTPDCIKHLKCGDFGLCVVYDYCDLGGDFSFAKGHEIWLLAWSMGVWAANFTIGKISVENFNLKRAVAINGTPEGIGENGISKDAFYKSLTNFDFEGFKKRCFLGLKDERIENFSFNQNAKIELANLYKNASKPCENSISWDKAIISKRDLIFPPNICAQYFQNRAFFISAPHFAFFNFDSFGEIFEI